VDALPAQIVEEVAMLDYSELIDRLEKLPVHETGRFVARAEFVAANANVDRLTRAFAWLRNFGETCGRQRAVTALKANSLLSA
jgi:hypothetical protein